MNPNTRSENNACAGDIASRARQSLQSRLRDVGLTEDVLVPLREKTKESFQDHTDPANRADLADLHTLGNYAVYPVTGLVVVDIDEPEKVPAWVRELPDTFAVASPHGGKHLYLVVDGDVSNVKRAWGEVRADRQYVVGPGSVLDHDGYCGDDCALTDETAYTVARDRPIAEVPASAISIETEESEESEPVIPEPVDSSDLSDIEAEFDVEKRFERMMDSAKGGRIEALWEGRFREAGFGDRSEPETALASYLAWWMDNNRRVVSALMDRANTKKWNERKDESYRKSVLNTACDHERTYEPGHGGPRDSLVAGRAPEVSWATEDRVLDALFDLRAASTREIAEHERVDRSQRQVRRALNWLIEDGLVDSVRDGRKVLYYPTIYESVLDELLDEDQTPQLSLRVSGIKESDTSHEPEPEPEQESSEGGTPEEPEIMTDGGIPESELREQYSETVIGTGNKANTLHIPDEESDEPEPLCGRPNQRGWRRVSIDCFPPGYHSWCEYCIEQETSERGTSETVVGNAAEADWAEV